MKLNNRERELILKHTFAEEELTGRSHVVPVRGEEPVYHFTLDEFR